MKYVSNVVGNILNLTCVDDLDTETAEMLAEEILKSSRSSVIDLQGRFSISDPAIRAIVPCALELRKSRKSVYVLNPETSIRHALNSMGLNTLLKCIDSLEELDIGQFSNPAPKKIDVSFLNPFIDGTLKTLELQCSTECKPLKPRLKDSNHDGMIDIAGVIGVTSETFSGSISICFPEKTFLGVVSSMLGEEFSEITQDLEDAAGELLNIIFGHAKRLLNEEGHSFQKAIPTVVRGDRIRLKHISEHTAFILPFETQFGLFFMEISAENLGKV